MAEHEAPVGIPSTPLRWRVRVCRWLWRVLRFVWGTLLVGIVIATIANFNTTATDTPLAKLYLVHLAQTYPLPLWSGLGLLSALTLLSWLGSRERQIAGDEQDHSHMLRRLRVRYEQIRAQSLQGAVQLELGLAERPAAVQSVVGLVLRLPDQPEQPLPPQTSIVQAYELAQQELLILGEPGAGKSTLLVELAHSLVEQVKQDAARPLPILLPLASWAERQRPLAEWLSEEIARLYDVPRRLSQHWVQAEQVLPLLDGLDEMEESARPACIAAINAYHREHLRPLVVCSRTSEYDAATRHERLVLHTAVVVQPLSEKQVASYLISLGKPLAALRGTLRKNTELRELATTPLMLQVLILTYQGTSVQELSDKEARLGEQIWVDYVQCMISRKGDVKHYPPHVTCAWLAWLAQQMQQRHLTEFYLERLQPDWLSNQHLWHRYVLSKYWLARLVGGLLDGFVGWVLFGPIGAILFWFMGSMIYGSLMGRKSEIEAAEVLTWSWKRAWIGLVVGVLLFGLCLILYDTHRGLLGGLFILLYLGLPFSLFLGLSRDHLPKKPSSSPNQGIWRSARYGATIGILSGLLSGVLAGLIGGLLYDPVRGLLSGLSIGTFFGLLLALLTGLDAFVAHFILRFWLWRSGVMPWHYVRFLEEAAARILLRRVGGGYGFAHRLLLDYVAHLGAQTPPAQKAAQTKSTPVQTKASTSADES